MPSLPGNTSPPEPIWVLVANVISERPWRDPTTRDLEWRPGTKHFSGGSKVYCGRPLGGWGWNSEFGNIPTLGRHRKSKDWVCVITRVSWLENFRVKMEYHPHVLMLLEKHGLEGGSTDDDRTLLESWAELGIAAAEEAKVRFRQLRLEANFKTNDDLD